MAWGGLFLAQAGQEWPEEERSAGSTPEESDRRGTGETLGEWSPRGPWTQRVDGHILRADSWPSAVDPPSPAPTPRPLRARPWAQPLPTQTLPQFRGTVSV